MGWQAKAFSEIVVLCSPQKQRESSEPDSWGQFLMEKLDTSNFIQQYGEKFWQFYSTKRFEIAFRFASVKFPYEIAFDKAQALFL